VGAGNREVCFPLQVANGLNGLRRGFAVGASKQRSDSSNSAMDGPFGADIFLISETDRGVMNESKARPLPQRTIGVLGGMSNQATGEYYRLLNERLNARLGGWDNGEIVIVSVNFGNIEHFVRQERWSDASTYLSGKIDRLEQAGADVILCVSNTMHKVVEPIMAARSTPFIHIADPTGEAIRKAKIGKVGLLGTMSIMQSEALAKRYADRFGIEIVTPSDADKVIVDRIIFDELVKGDLREVSKRHYIRVANELRTQGADGLVLGCTEIFMLMNQADLPGFPVFDTTELHVDAAVAFACSWPC
jgi:aspartate racemase